MRSMIIEYKYNHSYKDKIRNEIDDFLNIFVIYVAFSEF